MSAIRTACLALIVAMLLAAAPASAGAPCSDYWPRCTPAKAKSLAAQASDHNPKQLVQAAKCYAGVLQHGGDGDKLELAKKGAKLAKMAVAKKPDDAEAQYLLAVLIGLEARFDPFYERWADGLDMVPEIRKHAAKAASINPKLNHGGPDRALAELYMQAPSPPVSIGDPQKALKHFKQAVQADPHYPENRYQYAKALLKQNNCKEACLQLEAVKNLPANIRHRYPRTSAKALKIYARHCSGGH
ncbi:MAG: tetratricopeptide repeat protein [Desulfovibrionaceae bacterium]